MSGEGTKSTLALVIDEDAESRRVARTLLQARGYDVVHASTGVAALELIQRLPSSFGLVLLELDMRGLPGPAIREALSLFRPDLQVLCVSVKAAVVTAGCLRKPLESDELDRQLEALRTAPPAPWSGGGAAMEEARARAKACYAREGDLVEAAMELARGLPADD